MILGERDDSSFLVPWSVWSPKQMRYISGWTAGIRPPRLDTRNEKKTRGGRMRLSLTIFRDFTSAFVIQLPGWWMVLEFRTPEHLKYPVQTDISGFSLRYHFAFKMFDLYVLICLSRLTYISSPCSEAFFGTWCGATTEPYEATWPSFQTFFTVLHITGSLSIWPCRTVWLATADVVVAPGLFSLAQKVLFCSFIFFFFRCDSQTSQKCKIRCDHFGWKGFCGIQSAFPSAHPIQISKKFLPRSTNWL